MTASFIAKYGTTEHREKLMKYPDGREAMCKHGDMSHIIRTCDHLSKEYSIYAADASRKLKHPADVQSGAHVARQGTDEHREALMNTTLHDSRNVAYALAQYGSKSIKDRMIDHPDAQVRIAVAKYGDDSHRDKLVYDHEPHVRATVAYCGNSSHHEKLMNDPSRQVRTSVIGSTRSKKVINHMKSDSDGMIVSAAHRRQGEVDKMDNFLDANKDDPLLKTESILSVVRKLV